MNAVVLLFSDLALVIAVLPANFVANPGITFGRHCVIKMFTV